jgi:hypothetical protein
LSSSNQLTNAVTSGDESAVKALLTDGADVNERTSGGQTALILAVIFGHTHLVHLLVNFGADPQLRDNLGLNAIDWAKRRGLTEVLDVLENAPHQPARETKIVVNLEEPEKDPTEAQPKLETDSREILSEDEKSRRWLAGLKQRLREQELRRLNRNESAREVLSESPNPSEPAQPQLPEQESVTIGTKPARILEPTKDVSVSTTNRKRCPKCNAIYNGDLVSYCVHHIVPLVDVDQPVISEPPKTNPPLFWVLVIMTLGVSIVLASLITNYLYKTSRAAARTTASQPPKVQKGLPVLGGDLVGMEVSLPEAECPINGQGLLSGTVTVHVLVDKNGQVYWARGSGGDWLMRGAATEAAMKSTFSPEKLRSRETEGTITYKFNPQ